MTFNDTGNLADVANELVRRLTNVELIEAALKFEDEWQRRFPPLTWTSVPESVFVAEAERLKASWEREDPPGVETAEEILDVQRLSNNQFHNIYHRLSKELGRRVPAYHKWLKQKQCCGWHTKYWNRQILDIIAIQFRRGREGSLIAKDECWLLQRGADCEISWEFEKSH